MFSVVAFLVLVGVIVVAAVVISRLIAAVFGIIVGFLCFYAVLYFWVPVPLEPSLGVFQELVRIPFRFLAESISAMTSLLRLLRSSFSPA